MSYMQFYRQIFEDRCKEDEYGARYVVPEDNPDLRIYESQIKVHNFSHKKSKGSDPANKMNPDNVAIVTGQFHGQEHCSGEFHNHLGL